MELTLKSIKQLHRRGNGVTTFVASVVNGYLYTFVDNTGNEFTKYSFNIWGAVCKHRTELSPEIVKLREDYRACGMNIQADELETIEIPYEGDRYNFEFSTKENNQINRIKK
jgi:hypothetical protein